MDNSSQSTKRFSNRVEDYVKYRPDYPAGVLRILRDGYQLTTHHEIADIGSGTGLLTRLFLEHGNAVIGVEPNAEMRVAGEAFLAGYPRFTSLDGTAEVTGLPDASVDWITAGQAFHWFDPEATRAEFRRVLRTGGREPRVALIWNIAEEDGSPALRAYYDLCEEFGTDFHKVRQTWRVEGMGEFFTAGYQLHLVENTQMLDFEGLSGRLRSSSYIPKDGPKFEPMMARLREIFDTHAESGQFRFAMQTKIYVGAFAG